MVYRSVYARNQHSAYLNGCTCALERFVNSQNFSFHLCNEIKSTPKLENTHTHTHIHLISDSRDQLPRSTTATATTANRNVHWHHLYFSVAVSMIGLDFNANWHRIHLKNLYIHMAFCTHQSKISIAFEYVFPCKAVCCECFLSVQTKSMYNKYMYFSYSPVSTKCLNEYRMN